MIQSFKNKELYILGNPEAGDQSPLHQLLELPGLPARVQIRVVRLVKLISNEVNNLIDTRNKYVRLYGEDKGNGNFSLTGPNNEGKPVSPNWGKYVEEMDDLMAETTKLEFEKVVLPADIEISGRLLLDFEAFLEVAEEVPAENGQGKEPIPMKGRSQ